MAKKHSLPEDLETWQLDSLETGLRLIRRLYLYPPPIGAEFVSIAKFKSTYLLLDQESGCCELLDLLDETFPADPERKQKPLEFPELSPQRVYTLEILGSAIWLGRELNERGGKIPDDAYLRTRILSTRKRARRGEISLSLELLDLWRLLGEAALEDAEQISKLLHFQSLALQNWVHSRDLLAKNLLQGNSTAGWPRTASLFKTPQIQEMEQNLARKILDEDLRDL